jgi:hypothetical protein
MAPLPNTFFIVSMEFRKFLVSSQVFVNVNLLRNIKLWIAYMVGAVVGSANGLRISPSQRLTAHCLVLT